MHVRVPNALLEAEIITLRAIALKLKASQIAEPEFSKSRDHNATSYSTETSRLHLPILNRLRRDHNATSYSTETFYSRRSSPGPNFAEIITLRAIALKQDDGMVVGTSKLSRDHNATSYSTETAVNALVADFLSRRDHNATSYSTETQY